MLKAGPITVLGVTCGANLEGMRAAKLTTDGHSITAFGETSFRPFTADESRAIANSKEAAAEIIETAAAEALMALKKAELIGFFWPQTSADDPLLGDGAILAEILECPVVWNFAEADFRLGGRGRPIDSFFYTALGQWLKAEHPFAVVSLNGAGLVTYVDPSHSDPTQTGALAAFELKSTVEILEALVAGDGTLDLHDIKHVMGLCPKPPAQIIVVADDTLNDASVKRLSDGLNTPVTQPKDLDIDGVYLDSYAIAHTAARVAYGLATTGPNTTGVAAAVGGGSITAPG